MAYIRGLAEMRGRNADWAERAVREAVSLPDIVERAVAVTRASGADRHDIRLRCQPVIVWGDADFAFRTKDRQRLEGFFPVLREPLSKFLREYRQAQELFDSFGI